MLKVWWQCTRSSWWNLLATQSWVLPHRLSHISSALGMPPWRSEGSTKRSIGKKEIQHFSGCEKGVTPKNGINDIRLLVTARPCSRTKKNLPSYPELLTHHCFPIKFPVIFCYFIFLFLSLCWLWQYWGYWAAPPRLTILLLMLEVGVSIWRCLGEDALSKPKGRR